MHVSRFTLPGLCALLALSLAGCGRGTSLTSPRPASSVGAGVAGLTAGVDREDGTAPAAAPSGPKDAAPLVQILDPQPSPFLAHFFDASQPVSVRWTATDPDGPGPGVKTYRYVVLDLSSDPSNNVFLADPDSLLRRDGPAFTNWNEVDGRVDQVTLQGLTINDLYVLYVIAFDRKRLHDEHLDLSRNGLVFEVVPIAGPTGVTAASRGGSYSRSRSR